MKRIAIVYDWIDKQGGVERLLQSLHLLYPEADFYTSIYDSKKAKWAEGINITTSWMQKLPGFIKKNRLLSIVLFPLAFEGFNFTKYDLVISVSSSFAKGIITRPETKHINIMLTPTRFLWEMLEVYIPNKISRLLLAPIIGQLRRWDFIAAQRPDVIVAISKHVAKRCEKTYKRKSTVMYPPFDINYWENIKEEKIELPDKYFLIVSRLEIYKKVDVVIKAFNKNPSKHLVIAGIGKQKDYLKSLAKENIHFLDLISDSQLAYCYSNAQALVMLQEEDFGYTALEALYFDCPVITYKQSGTIEIVKEGSTGMYVENQTSKSLEAALERFNALTYNVTEEAEKRKSIFSIEHFKERLESIINS